MRSFIAVSRVSRQKLNAEIEAILRVLKRFDIETFLFVDEDISFDYQEKKIMDEVFSIIDNSDLFIAELSMKAMGVGIEAGYAKATNKIIIYLKNVNANFSKTLKGTCDFLIEYNDVVDLEFNLSKVLMAIDKDNN